MVSHKDSGERRLCPLCGDTFRETMPLGTGANVRWLPRPVCTRHSVNAKGEPVGG